MIAPPALDSLIKVNSSILNVTLGANLVIFFEDRISLPMNDAPELTFISLQSSSDSK